MCLDITYANPKKKYPKGKTYIGYKIFSQNINNTLSNVSANAIYTIFKTNKWIPDINKYILYTDETSEKYMTGFHLYASKQAANEYAKLLYFALDEVWKVEFRDVVAVGKQNGRKVIVARKIKLIERI